MMKRHMLGAFLGVQGVLVTTAAAHPGPPGHTHGEEWPFGALFGVVAAIAIWGAWRKISQGRAS